MSEKIKTTELTEEEIGEVSGGKSDRSHACGGQLIERHCVFCEHQKHGQHYFAGDGLHDTIGCNLFGAACPLGLGSVDGWIIADSVPKKCV